ncbi:MAG: biotin/lipoyl-containing protein, partial [Bacteroidales bacterium]
TGNPQDSYPDALAQYRTKMSEQSWPLGEDDEELFEYAMHPSQYEAYKSGKAKADFEADLSKRKAEKEPKPCTTELKPQTVIVELNGEKYKVDIAPDNGEQTVVADEYQTPESPLSGIDITEVGAPLEGVFFLTKGTESAVKVGDVVKKGQTLCYIEAMKTYNAIMSPVDGTVVWIGLNSGDKVYEDDILIKLK